MSDPARMENPSAAQAFARRARAANAVRLALGTVVASFAAAWLGWLLVSHDPTRIEWSMQGMLAGAALLAGTWSGYCRWREWSRPRARLQELLPLVRSGVMPIEELS